MKTILIALWLLGTTFLPYAAYSLAFEATEEARAFKTGNLKKVKRLIEQEKYFKDKPKIIIVEALYYAIDSGSLNLIKYLASRGWLEICRKEASCFPIHHAAYYEFKKSKSMIEFFITSDFSPYVVNQGGNTPLHYAARKGHIQLVKYLCELGVDVTIRNQYNKKTALELAVRNTGAGTLSSRREEDARIRVGLKKVIDYLRSGQCKKK